MASSYGSCLGFVCYRGSVKGKGHNVPCVKASKPGFIKITARQLSYTII